MRSYVHIVSNDMIQLHDDSGKKQQTNEKINEYLTLKLLLKKFLNLLRAFSIQYFFLNLKLSINCWNSNVILAKAFH